MLLVWAAYRFSFQGVPAPEFFAGIEKLRAYNAEGHQSYLLSAYSDHGFWYYFPVALFYKAPVAFLVLVALGIAWFREGSLRLPIAFFIGVLGVALFSRINIGSATFSTFFFGSLIAAGAALQMLESKKHGCRFYADHYFRG
jgi:hypothetical protein